jgi:uncharacterized membrane protein
LFEVALIPGIMIGGAAVLAPKLAPRRLPKLSRCLQPLFNSTVRRRSMPAVPLPDRPPLAARPRFAIKQALAKTITFRIIVTTLDFTWNYMVIGDLTTSAGLSAFGLAVGPLVLFCPRNGLELFWPFRQAQSRSVGKHCRPPGSRDPPAGRKGAAGRSGGTTINRALAKTITFRTIATITDFTTNYVVVGDLATAATLSAFGFVVGPFIYLGHEMAWDYYGLPREGALDLPTLTKLLPSPA